MSRNVIFIADYPYESQNEGELSFDLGDQIKILNSDGDWWFGELVIPKYGMTEGWLSPSYGHVVEELSPYADVSDQDKLNRRTALFMEIIRVETAFCQDLDIFNKTVVNSLLSRNTPFKRNFLNEASIAVSLNLLRDIFNMSSKFLAEISKADSAEKMALCYKQLAPALQLYAQYASENAACLNAVKSFGRQLREFTNENPLPAGLTLESCLVLPLAHYSKYATNFQEFVWLTPESKPEYVSLKSALEAVNLETVKVDDTLNELAASVKLLSLQSQFVGHPKIFVSSRRLMREGELERVRVTGGNVAVKSYYIHLFNDSLICSQRNASNDTFKLTKTVDLVGASVAPVILQGMMHTFSISGAGATEIFRSSPEEFQSWVEDIDSVIALLKNRKVDGRGAVTQASSLLPTTKNLDVRGQCVHKFLSSELRVLDQYSATLVVLIKPLLDASNGSELVVGGDGKSKVENVGKFQKAAITEALQVPEIKSFLTSAVALGNSLKDFVNSIRTQCEKLNWSEEICVGSLFNSDTSKNLFNHYRSYATGQQGCLRILKTPLFSQFFSDFENALSAYPGSLGDKLENPRNRPAQYVEFLNQLLQCTGPNHPDHQHLQAAIKILTALSTELEGTVKSKRNVEKLKEIQSILIVTTSLFQSVDSKFMQNLVSPERRFIKEGDLKKVCRKKNKSFRFWLFNDYLVYGSNMGNSSYSFNRALVLKTCSASILKEPKNSFQLNGAEKSFIVIAPSETARSDWVAKIREAREALGVKDDGNASTAPVWVSDHSGDGCCVCKQGFGLFRRRHHCRKCGGLVCGEHSKRTEVLAYIHKSAKQRVCDDCFGKDIVKAAISSHVETASASPQQQSIPTKGNFTNEPVTRSTITTMSMNASAPVSRPNVGATTQNSTPKMASAPSQVVPQQKNQYQAPVQKSVAPPSAPMPRSAPAPVQQDSYAMPAPPQSMNGGPSGRAVPPPPPPPPPPPARGGGPSHPSVPQVSYEADNEQLFQSTSIQSKMPPQAQMPPPGPPSNPFESDERYATYIKMKKLLPDGPVRQKMLSDGLLSEAEIDGFFAGVYVPSPGGMSGSVPQNIPRAAPQLRSVGASPVESKPAMGGMLAALQTVSLKQVDNDRKARPPSVAAKNAPGMLSMLATAMNNRRDFLKEDESDEDESDGGFSDDDFDDL